MSLLQNAGESGMIIINVSKERLKRAYSFGECSFCMEKGPSAAKTIQNILS